MEWGVVVPSIVNSVVVEYSGMFTLMNGRVGSSGFNVSRASTVSGGSTGAAS